MSIGTFSACIPTRFMTINLTFSTKVLAVLNVSACCKIISRTPSEHIPVKIAICIFSLIFSSKSFSAVLHLIIHPSIFIISSSSLVTFCTFTRSNKQCSALAGVVGLKCAWSFLHASIPFMSPTLLMSVRASPVTDSDRASYSSPLHFVR